MRTSPIGCWEWLKWLVHFVSNSWKKFWPITPQCFSRFIFFRILIIFQKSFGNVAIASILNDIISSIHYHQLLLSSSSVLQQMLFVIITHINDIIIIIIVLITLASRVHLSTEREGLPPRNKTLFPEHQVQSFQGKQQSFCFCWHREALLSYCY